MRVDGYTSDLVLLVADGNMEHTTRGLLTRLAALSIREVGATVIRHPEHDGGCRWAAQELLRFYLSSARYAIVLFDYEGSGETSLSRADLECAVENQLEKNGWEGRCGAVVIMPELERWVWTRSEEIPGMLGHDCTYADLLVKLVDLGFTLDENSKPNRPKEAVQALLRIAGQPRSSSLYLRMASTVSFQRCNDPSFQKLRSLLQRWFPVS